MDTCPLALLKKLITYDTSNPPGNEQALAEWLVAELAAVGFEAEAIPCGEGRASASARIVFGKGKKLVLNGHLDVVPAADGWKSDPFVPREEEGRLYGRGAADMKGGVAAMIAAALALVQKSDGLTGELVLHFVADEEIHNKGTLSCKQGWQDADYVVIGEPTNCDIHIAHRGTARFEVTVLGQSCHSSMPQNGINAAEQAAKAILDVSRYNASLASRHHPILPSPTAAVTLVSGGEKDNILPGECRFSIDRRMILGESGDSVEQELRDLFDARAKQDDRFSYRMRRYICLEAAGMLPEDEIVQRAQAVYLDCFGEPPVVRDFPATCEQALFTREGIPTIICGPGSIEQAHITDEYLEIAELTKAATFYEQFARVLLKKG